MNDPAPVLTPTRREIVRLLWRAPGLSTRGVARGVDLDESTAAYHLSRLKKGGEVVAERLGRVVAHYPNGWGDEKARRIAALSIEARLVLSVLSEELVPVRAVDVAKRSGLPREVVRHAIKTAVRLGLARRRRQGRYEVVA